jgi:hypothetical protein
MLHQVSTRRTIGKVSGLGWGLGYIGGIVALVIVVVLTFADWSGSTPSDGLAYRLIAVGAAVWTVVFSIPIFLNVPEAPPHDPEHRKVNFFAGYALLVKDLVRSSRPPAGVLVPVRERDLPRRARRHLRLRGRSGDRRVRLRRERGDHLRDRRQRGRGISTIFAGRADDRSGRKAGHRVRADRPRHDGRRRVRPARSRQHRVLGRRADPRLVRRTGAGREPARCSPG